MTTPFDRDTTFEPLGDGRFAGTIGPEWLIYRGPNGGYLGALLLRAMTDAVDDVGRAARSLTVHYTRPPTPGPIELQTTVERSGRSLTTVSARLVQDDRLCAIALAAFSVPWTGPEFSDARMPATPAPDEVEPSADRPEMPFLANFDYRWVIGVTELGQGDRAESGAWMRLRGGRVLDTPAAAMFMDGWAPAVFAKIVVKGGIPTVDMTWHFREPLPLDGAGAHDFYLGVFRTTTSRQGFLEEDGELWSADGRLLVQSRQLALLLTEG